jgi:hypothetical protein
MSGSQCLNDTIRNNFDQPRLQDQRPRIAAHEQEYQVWAARVFEQAKTYYREG